MCGFKVGDEVQMFRDRPAPEGVKASPHQGTPVGWVGRVTAIYRPFWAPPEVYGILLDNWALPSGHYHDAGCYRRVERRDLTAWLAAENTIEGPKRPARTPEPA